MKTLTRILFSALILLFPLIIIGTAIRITLTPIFISMEYRLPGFPSDDYGFSTEDRLTWADYSIDYLLGRISHAELESTTLPDGSPLYNQRELIHMLDVRVLTRQVLIIWQMLVFAWAAITIFGTILNQKHEILLSLKRGALLTIMMIVSVLIYLAVNFNQLFTQFHQLFFEGDSWLFLMSDNLIRLFPLRFWRDIFIFIGGLSAALSLLILLIPIRISKRSGSD
jgi:integral membrane protein (TIGR01906 family)